MVRSVIGIFEHERIFKLAFLVDGREVAELLVGVVTLAIVEVRRGVGVEGDLDATEVSVLGRVCSVVAEHVVIGDGLLRIDDACVEIVVVEQRLAAGILRQRVERVL